MRALFQLLVCSTALLAADALAVSVEDVPNPRDDRGWVSDGANMISSTDEIALNSIIELAEAELNIEIAVVTVEDVDTATPKDFATELFNYWGIGKATTNNGLLVLMVKSQRRLEMETGYGTETVLTDGWLKTMQQREMVPLFKQGEFGRGIRVGVAESIERLKTYEMTGSVVDPSDAGETPPWLWWLFGGGGALGGVAGVRRVLWKKQRTCAECSKMMSMLPEDEDDEHLTEGQQTEEAIGSVDWEYWYCEVCEDSHKLIGVGKLMSGFSRCPSCNHKTLSSSTNTITVPTRYSSGTAEVVSNCAHCEHHSRTMRTLPRLPAPSSSSSSSFGGGGSGGSSGGSFGGGSSGGGGSGSSW